MGKLFIKVLVINTISVIILYLLDYFIKIKNLSIPWFIGYITVVLIDIFVEE